MLASGAVAAGRIRCLAVLRPADLPPSAGSIGLATVLVIDSFILTRLPPRPLSGVVDEAAHVATAVALLGAMPGSDPGFARGLLAASVLLDVDHVPELWGRGWLRPRGARPVPHSITTPALVLWQASRTRNRGAFGAAVGLAGHLLRDLATGRTGVALLWPLTRRPFSVRYRKYAAALALLAAVGASRPASARLDGHTSGRYRDRVPGASTGAQGNDPVRQEGGAGERMS